MTISVICPTRNRADIWRSGWLLDSLATQTRKPDELLIAVDHTEDDTLTAIANHLSFCRFPIRTEVLDVLAPRPGPFPASGLPDNCLFHHATSDVIIHVDDDISIPDHFVEHTEMLFDTLPNISIWYPMTFVDEQHKPLVDGRDWRYDVVKARRMPIIAAGLVRPNPAYSCATGAIFATTTNAIRTIGGHASQACGYHNQDTMLGYRLSSYCTGGTYFATSPTTTALHRGLTWHMHHIKDPAALRIAYGRTQPGPAIANGGLSYWLSNFWQTAYTIAHIHDLTTTPQRLPFHRVMLRPGAKVEHHATPARPTPQNRAGARATVNKGPSI